MKYVRTSARALIQRGDELLVVRYQDERGDWYVLPGGGQRHGEHLEKTLQREVEEETGATVRVGPLRFVRECVAGPDARGVPTGFHQLELVFACELMTPPAQGAVPDPTQVSVEWRSRGELRGLCFFPHVLLDALERREPVVYLGVA